jgi:hypothetical protein
MVLAGKSIQVGVLVLKQMDSGGYKDTFVCFPFPDLYLQQSRLCSIVGLLLFIEYIFNGRVIHNNKNCTRQRYEISPKECTRMYIFVQ